MLEVEFLSLDGGKSRVNDGGREGWNKRGMTARQSVTRGVKEERKRRRLG